jgi:hypothetical protein
MSAPVFQAEQFLAKQWALDKLLERHRFHRMPDWWRAEWSRVIHALAARGEKKARKHLLRLFGKSSMFRRWIARVGRRGGKSSSLARFCVAWWKWGFWGVPAGDLPVFAFVSTSKDEANSRLRAVGSILTAMGEPFEQRADEIETTGERKALFKVFACSAKLAVGFTSVMVVCDEVSRWESRETASNPAAEVIGSIAPTLATQPYGFMILSSSPWSTDDYHATAFDKGNTDAQLVSFAPTWVANPTLSEEATHAEEPDPRIWAREYAAEPGNVLSAALDEADVLACFRALPVVVGAAFTSIDASSLRGDAFTWITGGTSAVGEIVVTAADGWQGEELRSVSMQSIVEVIAGKAREIGTLEIYGDQREEASLRALFDQQGVYLRSFAWSEPSKDEAMQLLRRLMRERKVVLVGHDKLKRELRNMKARLLPSGRIRYETNGLDYASALITLMHAHTEGHYVPSTEEDLGLIGIASSRADGRFGSDRRARSLASALRDS